MPCDPGILCVCGEEHVERAVATIGHRHLNSYTA
jgi:hypothetical protein